VTFFQRNSRQVRWVFVAVVLLLAALTGWVALMETSTANALRHDGKATSALVEEVDGSVVKFMYVVGDRRYEGSDVLPAGVSVRVGALLKTTYLPSDPSVAVLGMQAHDQIAFAATVATVVWLVLSGFLVWRGLRPST
jgi:hypothetical protein